MMDDRKMRLELLLKEIEQEKISLSQTNEELSKYPAISLFDGKKK